MGLVGLLHIPRELEGEYTAFADFTCDLQSRSMFISDGFANRKSEARAAAGASSRFIGAVKAVKNMRQMLFGDATASVVDGEEGMRGV